MKYFDLTKSNDIRIVGEIPQVSATENNLFGSPFSPINVRYDKILDKIPLLELEFEKKAKKTDLLSSYNIYFGLLISEKIKQIVSDFNLPNHKFYHLNLLKNKKNVNGYYFFHFYDNLFHYLDYKKTKIAIMHKFNFSVLDEFVLQSEEHLKEIKSSLKFEEHIRLKELHFNDTFPNYDIMTNNILGFQTLISEKLLFALQENDITGYEVSEYHILKLE